MHFFFFPLSFDFSSYLHYALQKLSEDEAIAAIRNESSATGTILLVYASQKAMTPTPFSNLPLPSALMVIYPLVTLP
jgi:hypothetical protein